MGSIGYVDCLIFFLSFSLSIRPIASVRPSTSSLGSGINKEPWLGYMYPWLGYLGLFYMYLDAPSYIIY
jgi:hypothetical protein